MSVSEPEVVALLSDLVAIPSVNPGYRAQGDPAAWFGEAAIGDYVADWLRRIGVDVEVDPVEPGRSNVIARLKGGGHGRRLIWEGHLDTVHVTGMTIDPFLPTLREGRLYGRGAVDDKACLTAFMLALRELARQPPACDITFLAAVDEEHQFRGISHFLERHEPFDFGIAGEPTSRRIVRACKGCVRWTIDVVGRAAHSSKPDEGIDAILLAADLVGHLRRVAGRPPGEHPLLGPRTLTCTMLQAGQGPNVVADKATLTFDRRTLPGETGQEAWAQIGRIVQDYCGGWPEGARAVMNPPFIDALAMEVPETSAVVAHMQDTCRAFGIEPASEGVPYGSDASQMTGAGIPTIIFGPGSIDQAHTAAEFVEVREVALAADMLVAHARRC